MKIEQIFIQFSSTIFHENLFSDSHVVICVQVDGWTDQF